MHPRRSGPAAAVLAAAAIGIAGSAALAQDEAGQPRPEISDGRTIFQRDCATCHGPDGRGTTQGPTLHNDGAAGVHFYVATGRMPLSEPDEKVIRREPRYTPDEIAALVAYAGELLGGPPAVEVTPDELLLARGAAQFRLNCAACHQFMGVGGALVGDRHAPNLTASTASEVVESIRIGPGTMPQWRPAEISDEEARAIATYVALEIQQPTDAGGLALGHFGPSAEGAVAWIIGVGALLSIARWIGGRT